MYIHNVFFFQIPQKNPGLVLIWFPFICFTIHSHRISLNITIKLIYFSVFCLKAFLLTMRSNLVKLILLIFSQQNFRFFPAEKVLMKENSMRGVFKRRKWFYFWPLSQTISKQFFDWSRMLDEVINWWIHLSSSMFCCGSVFLWKN